MFSNNKEYSREDNGQLSSMRKGFLALVDLTKVMVGTMCVVMIAQTFKNIPVDFQGAAFFLAGVAAFLAPVFGFKAVQKGNEKPSNQNQTKRKQ